MTTQDMPNRVVINGIDFTEPLTAAQVGRIFGVDPRTVARWANQGELDSVRTVRGHRRFSRAQILERLAASHSGSGNGQAGGE